jgi:hypothetical protein
MLAEQAIVFVRADALEQRKALCRIVRAHRACSLRQNP